MDTGFYSPYIFLAAYLLAIPISLAIYRLYFHPLAKVPGPRLAAITPLWYAYQIKKSQLFSQSQELHEKYGPAVRIAPNEVQFDSREAFQAIYGGTGYLQKSDFYHIFNANLGQIDWLLRRRPRAGDGNAGFTINGELDIQRHRALRRNIGTTYSAASVRKYRDRIDGVLRRFVAKLAAPEAEAEAEGRTLDLAERIHSAVVECIGAATLGGDWPLGLIDDAGAGGGSWDMGVAKWRQVSVLGFLPSVTRLVQRYPKLRPAVAALGRVAIPKVPGHVPLDQTAIQIIRERASRFTSTSGEKLETEPADAPADMLDELLRLSARRPDFKPHYAAGMAAVNFIAGRDTTTATVIAALALICSDPGAKARVEAEVLGRGPDVDIEKCGYTQACIRETLRLRPVTALSLSRVVPSNASGGVGAKPGRGAGGGLQLHGYDFPPGTVVGVNAPAMQLNPAIFGPDAAIFRPERWLEDGEEGDDGARRKIIEKTSLAWGGGAHVCPGRHLAELIMSRLVPLLISDFDIEIVAMPRIEDMHSFSYFSTMEGVKARFRARPRSEVEGTEMVVS